MTAPTLPASGAQAVREDQRLKALKKLHTRAAKDVAVSRRDMNQAISRMLRIERHMALLENSAQTALATPAPDAADG